MSVKCVKIQELNVASSDAFLEFVKSSEKPMHRIYVCSPLSSKTQAGVTANMLTARDKCNVLNGILKGYDIKVWAPHAYVPFILDDNVPAERAAAMAFGVSLLKMSDALYVCGQKLSEGMKSEIKFAVTHSMDILVENNLSEAVETYIDEVIKNQDMDGDA